MIFSLVFLRLNFACSAEVLEYAKKRSNQVVHRDARKGIE
jgi:bifunctional pyridoxal-dependent enzyme with beta-cystathionase and maltose regulon repressor activities